MRSSIPPKCQPKITRVSAIPSDKLPGQKSWQLLVGILGENMTHKFIPTVKFQVYSFFGVFYVSKLLIFEQILTFQNNVHRRRVKSANLRTFYTIQDMYVIWSNDY